LKPPGVKLWRFLNNTNYNKVVDNMSVYTIRLADQNSGFFDPITKLHLTYYNPIGKVDSLSDPINRGIRLRTLVLVSTEEDAQLQPTIIIPPDAEVVVDVVVSDVVIIPPDAEVAVADAVEETVPVEDEVVVTEEVTLDEPQSEEAAATEDAEITPAKSPKKSK
jgi:hypothetical protein